MLVIMLSGCWNYKELNEYSIVTGIAIDKNNDEYKVSTLISNVPKGNSGSDNSSSNSEIVVYEGKGKSISQALKDIGLVSPKELYLNSFYILVISDDVAKDGIIDVLDFFLKYSSSRNNFNVIITKGCKAKDTLKIMTSITNFPSQSIADNLKTTTELQGAVKTTSFDDLIKILIEDGMEPTISTITIVGDQNEGFTRENLETSEPKAYVKLDNLAIFKGDKLIDFANHDESIGINIISNDVNEMYFSIDYKDGFVIVDTTSFKSKIKSNIKNDKPYINISNTSKEGEIYLNNNNTNKKSFFNCYILLELSEEETLKRMSNRLKDPNTGIIYHKEYSPPNPTDKKLNERLIALTEPNEEKIKDLISEGINAKEAEKIINNRALWHRFNMIFIIFLFYFIFFI